MKRPTPDRHQVGQVKDILWTAVHVMRSAMRPSLLYLKLTLQKRSKTKPQQWRTIYRRRYTRKAHIELKKNNNHSEDSQHIVVCDIVDCAHRSSPIDQALLPDVAASLMICGHTNHPACRFARVSAACDFRTFWSSNRRALEVCRVPTRRTNNHPGT
jgi:hypothetical protein